jgi:quinol monooxygenase YgiN
MILRLVRARVLPGRDTALRVALHDALPARIRATEGLLQVHVGLRDADGETEILFITIWSSVEAVVAAVGGDVARMAVLEGISEHIEVHGVDLFEVDESSVRTSAAEPLVLRTSAGWIELGPDVEIQQELRRRMRELGDELLEAYVGRRMRGRSVEVTFVSVWAATSEDRPLDEAIWPDISARYQSFRVETYRAVSGLH